MTLTLPTGTTHTTRGLIIGVAASLAFGTSGAFVKPLLEAGWSPTAAVTLRAGAAGLVLLPFAIATLRGRWCAVWRARGRIRGMAVIGVGGSQVLYFAAIERVPVSTALLIEYLAPLLLVALMVIRTRRPPKAVVLAGSAAAIAGLVLVVGVGGSGDGAASSLDPLGLLYAGLAAIAVAAYYLIAARPSDGLPSVAFAAAGLLVGAVMLAVLGASTVVPFTFNFVDAVPAFGMLMPWWVPLGFVVLVSTAFAYVASIRASGMLGSRLMSFVGLLEVVFASVFAWVLIGESLTPLQLLGGGLILAGIAFVRMEKDTDAPLEPGAVDTVSIDTSAILTAAGLAGGPIPYVDEVAPLDKRTQAELVTDATGQIAMILPDREPGE
ncbi:MAG: EamA family transporter [Rhodoglobus sp.]|nr:EamA family transporter [Rhodoglobus sp.]